MKELKILILTAYYDRPKMIEHGLHSILKNNETYKNWEYAFIDDGSKSPGKPIVEEILKGHLNKVKFYCTNDTIEKKLNLGGHRSGEFFNYAIKDSDADVAISLADDDILYTDYLFNLNRWFNNNPGEPYSCSDLIWFDPMTEIASENIIRDFGQNCATRPRNRLERQEYGDGVTIEDMAWQIKCNKEGNIWFPYPDLVFLDNFKVNLWKKYGEPITKRQTHFFACYKSLCNNNLLRKYIHCDKNPKNKCNYKMDGIIYEKE